jgi:hypothetical protein
MPIADLRPLLHVPSGRLPVPAWPDPRSGVDFVRSLGVVQDRRRGPIDATLGEAAFCRADRLLRLADGMPGLKVIYRRLFSSGVACRVDVAVRMLEWDARKPSDGDLVDRLLSLPVRTGADPRVRTLGASAPAVAAGLRVATSSRAFLATDGAEEWWCAAGLPAILLEKRAADSSTGIVGSRYNRPFQQLPMWKCWLGTEADWTKVRQQRGHIWHTQMVLEALRQTIRAWDRHPDDFDFVSLTDYLDAAASELVARRSGGVDDHPRLLAFNWGFEPLAADNVLRNLIDQVLLRSKGVARKLELMMERGAAASGGSVVIKNYVNAEGGQVTVENRPQQFGNVGAVVNDSGQISGGTFQGQGVPNIGGDWSDFIERQDLAALQAELATLRDEMRKVAREPEHDGAVAEVGYAEKAAKEGDKEGLRRHLATAGKWALEVAKGVGIATAAAAIKVALGI